MSHTTVKARQFAVQLGDRGRFVLPAAIRSGLEVEAGDRLLVTLAGPGVAKLTSARRTARGGRGLLAPLTAGRSLVEELLAERREEGEDG